MKRIIVLLIGISSGALLFGQTAEDFIINDWELEDGGDVGIQNNITAIEDGAFSGNKNLVVVNIPYGVTRIGAGAFRGCEGLTIVSIAYGLIIIDEYAFASCKNLAAISIPPSVTYIGTGAFSGCVNLRAVSMSRKTQLAPDVFRGAPVNILYID
ncbi:hypothetical protein FACS1894110_16320 [Spirochaetia bacterium]|nr:hypothetical protein FACS1894110_16320 [Spirochaetia bacterium]